MAAVDVQSAVDVLQIPSPAETVEDAIGFSSKLLAPGPSLDAQTDKASLSGRFVLNQKSFVDLQAYLKAARKLPVSIADFENIYQPAAFRQWTERDKKGDDLYNKMRDTLCGIYAHCDSFTLSTVASMQSFASAVANFSDEVKRKTALIDENMKICIDPKLTINDPKLQDAIAAVWGACESLIAQAKDAPARAATLQKDILGFKETTKKDKDLLDDVNVRTDAVLPTTQDLKSEERRQLEEIRITLQQRFEQQVEVNRRYGFPQNGMLYVSVLGYSGYVRDQQMKNELEEEDRKVLGLFKNVESSHAAAIQLKSKTETLKSMIDNIADTMTAAIAALQEISGAFATFETAIGSILTSLGLIDGQIHNKLSFLRKRAQTTLADAGKVWNDVYEAAQFFVTNGALLERGQPAPTNPVQPVPGNSDFEALGANFGSLDASSVARLLFQKSEDRIEVPGLVRELGDPWASIEKTFSMLYNRGTEFHTFVSREYVVDKNFTYVLAKNPAYNETTKAVNVKTSVEGGFMGSSRKADILAIVWGPTVVTDASAWSYISNAIDNTSKIKWENDNLGGETWKGALKTGTVYYRYKGTTLVRQISGKEHYETMCPV